MEKGGNNKENLVINYFTIQSVKMSTKRSLRFLVKNYPIGGLILSLKTTNLV